MTYGSGKESFCIALYRPWFPEEHGDMSFDLTSLGFLVHPELPGKV